MKHINVIHNISSKADPAVLINSLHKGEEEGLEGIYRLYSKRILFFAQKYVKNYQIAEEIVADVFVKVWERRMSFSSIDRVRAFLYLATKNRCLNQLRDTNVHENIDDLDNYEDLLSEDID